MIVIILVHVTLKLTGRPLLEFMRDAGSGKGRDRDRQRTLTRRRERDAWRLGQRVGGSELFTVLQIGSNSGRSMDCK